MCFATSVVDQGPRKKRSKAGLNVFRFAETVEVEAWEDERKKKDLEVSTLHSVLAIEHFAYASF